jgi:hypothetical protein
MGSRERLSPSGAKRGGDFVFQKRAKQIKIISVEEMPEAQRKLEQGHTGCPRRI